MSEQDDVPGTQREPNDVEPARTEDDARRSLLGPRGIPGQPDLAKMTLQRAKKTPQGDFDGYTA